jgi:hypothetical protein
MVLDNYSRRMLRIAFNRLAPLGYRREFVADDVVASVCKTLIRRLVLERGRMEFEDEDDLARLAGAGAGVGGREEGAGEGEDDEGEDEQPQQEQQEVAELATGLGLRFLRREEADGAERHPDLAPLEEEMDRDRDAESGEGGE